MWTPCTHTECELLFARLPPPPRSYTIVPPEGSPFFRIYRVFKGAYTNRKLTLPEHPNELYGGWI
jgi:hypothetical protein